MIVKIKYKIMSIRKKLADVFRAIVVQENWTIIAVSNSIT